MIALIAVAACDKGAPAAPATPADADAKPAAGAEDAAPTATPTTWAEAEKADLDAQIAFMKANVMPAMKPVLGQGEHTLTCKTCHGPDNARPQDYLPALTLVDGHIAEFETQPEASKFMAEQVVPAMAAAMGEPPYDPATGEGFGCAGCHAIKS